MTDTLHVTVDPKHLTAALRFVTLAVPARAPLAVLLHVRIAGTPDGVTLSAFDIDLSTSELIDGTGTGVGLVPGRFLLDVAKHLDAGPVTISQDGPTITVRQGELTFTAEAGDLEEYPALPVTDGTSEVATLTGADLTRLARVTVAASKDGTMPVLTAIALTTADGTLTSAATDRYRLAVQTTDLPATVLPERLLVPAGTFGVITKAFGADDKLVLSVTDDRRIVAAGERRTVTGRLLDGTFPTYERLFPADSDVRTVATFDAKQVGKALGQVSVVIDKHAAVRVAFEAGTVALEAGDDTRGARKALPDTFSGDDVTIAFTPDYLADGLKATGPDVHVSIAAATRPAVFTAADDSTFRYLLMPQRLN